MEVEQLIAAQVEKLRQNGLRITPQRIEIIKTMLRLPTHPSADIVFQLVRRVHPTISLATVYTTLDTLARVGVLQEVAGTAERRFDGYNRHPHGHLVCRCCAAVEDMELPPQLDALFATVQDFQAESLQLTLTGLCASCRGHDGRTASKTFSHKE